MRATVDIVYSRPIRPVAIWLTRRNRNKKEVRERAVAKSTKCLTPIRIHKRVYRQRRYQVAGAHSLAVNVYPWVINIQETLDQILFTPAIINLGIDVLADTFAPCPERVGRNMGRCSLYL